MLLRTVRSIRSKPKELRDQYAFWIAVIVTAVVALPWFFGLPDRLQSEAAETQSVPMFSSLIDTATDRWSQATEGLPDIEAVIEAEPTPATTTPEVDMVAAFSTTSPTTTPTSTPRTMREVRIATTTTSTTQ